MTKLVLLTFLGLCASVVVAEDAGTDGARSEERLVYSARVEVCVCITIKLMCRFVVAKFRVPLLLSRQCCTGPT